jgi:hypothetical protein
MFLRQWLTFVSGDVQDEHSVTVAQKRYLKHAPVPV